MAVDDQKDTRQWFSDKEALRDLIRELDAKADFTCDPTMTRERLREILLAQGIRPEDNLLSRDIIRAKYPDEAPDEG